MFKNLETCMEKDREPKVACVVKIKLFFFLWTDFIII